jgi:hypothetical protein
MQKIDCLEYELQLLLQEVEYLKIARDVLQSRNVPNLYKLDENEQDIANINAIIARRRRDIIKASF